MRTEVKLGLAVGVVLLAVLIVYMVVVPKRAEHVESTLPPENPGEISTVEVVTPPTTQVATTAPTTEPVAPLDSSVPPIVTGLTPPTTAPVAGGDRWSVLETGRLTPGGTTPAGGTLGLPGATHADPIPQPVSGGRTHIVQSGETLSSISASVYGNPNLYPKILRANPKLNPHRLRVGQKIIIPELNENTTATTLPTAVDELPHSLTTGGGSDLTYRVQSGDSLHRIAFKLYGKSDMWQKIYDLNKETIGPDSARLKLGMVLKLPAAPTATSASHQ